MNILQFHIAEDGGIPSQFPVQEETQFLQLLRESLDFFSIEEKTHGAYALIDYKSRKYPYSHSQRFRANHHINGIFQIFLYRANSEPQLVCTRSLLLQTVSISTTTARRDASK